MFWLNFYRVIQRQQLVMQLIFTVVFTAIMNCHFWNIVYVTVGLKMKSIIHPRLDEIGRGDPNASSCRIRNHSFSISRSIWLFEKVKIDFHIALQFVYHFISQGLQNVEVKWFIQHSIYISVALCWTEVPHWWLFCCKMSVTIDKRNGNDIQK
jgi:hypothetical protein